MEQKFANLLLRLKNGVTSEKQAKEELYSFIDNQELRLKIRNIGKKLVTYHDVETLIEHVAKRLGEGKEIITKVEFYPPPNKSRIKALFDYDSIVYVQTYKGRQEIFRFRPSEVVLKEDELLGMTVEQAKKYCIQKRNQTRD